jgi:cytoskeletal protein CcmA (bactofilin family)
MEDKNYAPNDLLINEGVSFVGTAHVSGCAKVNGSFTGELVTETLEIGQTGLIKGRVRAKEIDVSGVLMDDVVCQGLLQIRNTGTVNGKLTYSDLDIERGGRFEGDIHNKII